MRTPTQKTVDRRAEKAQWLREHVKYHSWLIDHATAPLHAMSRKPEASALCRLLKDAGLYSRTTVTLDICASMRRTAVQVELGSVSPTEQAKAEIHEILTRPGVRSGEVVRCLTRAKAS